MVKITPFSCFIPISPEEYSIPQINLKSDNLLNLRPIISGSNIAIHSNKKTRNPNEIFAEVLNLNSSMKYEKLQRYWKQYETLGLFKRIKKPSYYVYRLQFNVGNKIYSQIGLLCCVHLDSDILYHENTIEEKVLSQYYRLEESKTSISPVYLMYKDNKDIKDILKKITYTFPIIDFFASNDVRHSIWRILDKKSTLFLSKSFEKIPTLFIADGHHRVESSKYLRKILKRKNKNHKGDEGYNYILSSIFPISQLQVLEYNRIVKNIRNFKSNFLPYLDQFFEIENVFSSEKPLKPGQIIMYRKNKWFKLEIKNNYRQDETLKKRLDTYRLQKFVFEKILGIRDVRTSKKLIYVSGNRSITEIQNTTDLNNGIAFILYPISINEIVEISENNDIVPPKSTWFEPKLLKGMMFWKIK